MKYKSELIKDIVDTRGHEKSSLHYESECVEPWIEETKGAYPKLCDYESEWLNYINENPIGEFPYMTLTDVTQATVNNVVPYSYKSAILKGQTLVNIINNDNWSVSTDTRLFIQNISIKKGQIYTIIGKIETNDVIESGHKPVLRINTGTNNSGTSLCFIEQNEAIIKQTFTNNENETIHVRFFNQKTNYKKLMIIEGDYTNIDIPYFEGMQSVKMPVLTTTGKNLFDVSTLKDIRTNYDYTVGTYKCKKIKLEPNKTYTVSAKASDSVGTLFFNNIPSIATGSNYLDFRKNTAISKEYTTDDKGYLYVGTSITDDNTIGLILDRDIQIEQGEIATPYEPFKSNILTVNEPVELRGVGVVQDTLDCLKGELTQRIDEVVWDGSDDELWGYNGDYDLFVCQSLTRQNDIYLSTNIIEKVMWNGVNCFALKPSKYGFTSHKEGIEYLKNNPITIQYKLATESVKTVDLSIVNQDGESLSKLKPIEGTMHIATDGNPIKPTFSGEIPVEAITQNLASFIEEE